MRSLIPSWSLFVSGWTLLSGIACSGTNSTVGSGGSESVGGAQNTGGGGSVQGGNTSSAGASGIGGAPTGGRSQTGGITSTGIANTGGAVMSTGGQGQTGGAPSTGGSKASTGGAVTVGGSPATGGSKATGGVPIALTGGATSAATGGSKANTGGTPATGGSKATGGSTASATGGASSTTGCGVVNKNPFNCKFAWGAPSSGTNYNSLNFVSTWVGDETNGGLGSWTATATNSGALSQTGCGDCSLVKSVASTSSMVVFYAYFIGFQACKQSGYCDCNTSGGTTLCTNGAQWIRSNRATIVNAYGQYAKAVYANSPSKPVIWWLEGDFIQYTTSTQSSPLTYAEAGQLTRDITCAIKSNEPNAVVAMNHSPWNADAVSQSFWTAMPKDVLDLIWVQGPADTDTLTNSGTYNATTANYNWLHTYTGLNIMAETSFAGSGTADRWSTTTAANINARIANGVIAVHVNSPASNYTTAFGALNSSLTTTCN